MLGLVGGSAGKGQLALQAWGLGVTPVIHSHTCNASSTSGRWGWENLRDP